MSNNLSGRRLSKINELEVIVKGDLVDKYGNSSIEDLGRVDLTAPTEKMFNWDGLDFNSAWTAYDSAWLLPDLLI